MKGLSNEGVRTRRTVFPNTNGKNTARAQKNETMTVMIVDCRVREQERGISCEHCFAKKASKNLHFAAAQAEAP